MPSHGGSAGLSRRLLHRELVPPSYRSFQADYTAPTDWIKKLYIEHAAK